MRQVILFISIISIIFSESGHVHNHSHNNEFAIAVGVVPGHEDEDDNIGLHLHYVKGIGEHNDFGIGLSLETILDEHAHHSVSLITIYRFSRLKVIPYLFVYYSEVISSGGRGRWTLPPCSRIRAPAPSPTAADCPVWLSKSLMVMLWPRPLAVAGQRTDQQRLLGRLLAAELVGDPGGAAGHQNQSTTPGLTCDQHPRPTITGFGLDIESDAPSPLNGLRQLGQHRLGGFPGNTRVGDALAVHRGFPLYQILPPLHQVALQHDAEDVG